MLSSPLIAEKEEVPDGYGDRLEQNQPAHEAPLGPRSGFLHPHFCLQRWLRKDKRRDELPRILSAHVSLQLNLIDRFGAVTF